MASTSRDTLPVERPDARQIATFFLGAVFVETLRYFLLSPFLKRLFRRPGGISSTSSLAGSSTTLSRSHHHAGYWTLDFLLPVCFAAASLAHFASLLAFDGQQGATGCAFVVAFGGITQQLAHLLASTIVLLDLRPFIHLYETIGCFVWLSFGAASAFTNNALSTGSLSTFQALGTSFCSRKSVPIPGIISAALYLSLETYFILRTLFVFQPDYPTMSILLDPKILRPVALLVLELLVFIPFILSLSVAGYFIPFSIGTLLVLAAFQCKTRLHPSNSGDLSPSSIDEYKRGDATSYQPPVWIAPPPPPAVPPMLRDSPRVNLLMTSPEPDTRRRSNHPFAAVALNDRTMVRESGWFYGEGSSGSPRTIGSVSTTNIGEKAEVRLAERANVHQQPTAEAKLLNFASHSSSRKGTRKILSPEMQDAVAASRSSIHQEQELDWPVAPHIPPPVQTPLSVASRPHLTVGVPSHDDDLDRPARDSALYGSDIIRMSAAGLPPMENALKSSAAERYSATSFSRMSHLTYATSSEERGSSRPSSYGTGPAQTSSVHNPPIKRWPTFGGKSRRTSAQSKRTTATSYGQEIPPRSPLPPLPLTSPNSSRPLPTIPSTPLSFDP